MEWRGRRRSANVEDRRGQRMRPRGAMIGGGLGGVILLIAIVLLSDDPARVLNEITTGTPGQQSAAPIDPANDQLAEFVSVVLADTEDVWHEQFRQMGRTYQEPTLVLFRDQVQSACGFASAAVGPFYCPGDNNVYLDLSFFEELASRFDAPGDFAQAYVIAHEIGHHVQNLLGTSDRLHAARGRVSETEYNELSVRLELQADFLAGVWAHHAERMHGILERGDIEEGLRAASAIGDDRLQRQTQGYVVPDSFTHGTSAQRIRWFTKGFETGDVQQGDTFAAAEL